MAVCCWQCYNSDIKSQKLTKAMSNITLFMLIILEHCVLVTHKDQNGHGDILELYVKTLKKVQTF